jgi:2,4-dienoyl-CoA reductase-like NADH-dependent reductase (Old Yellow Enzyme family)
VKKLLKRVLEPIDIGRVTIPNRIVLSPINTSFCDRSGNVTEKLLRFHRAIAKGGVGLSIVGSTAISPEGKVNYFGLMLDTDRLVSGLSRLFSVIGNMGSVPAIQLMHAGRQTFSCVTGKDVVAPSSRASPYFKVIPRILIVPEIEHLVKEFADAASRAKKAGARLIELHGAHGYLIGQFLSPYSNKRRDEYGGSLGNRARFFCHTIEETKKQLGQSFPVICRISVSEFVRGGITPKDSMKIAKILVESGADCISVSAGIYGQKEKIYPTKLYDQKMRFNIAEKIRKIVRVPVICSGRIANLFEAEQMLRKKKADMIAMARALIADQNLVKKSLRGNPDSISACTWCNECIYDFKKFQRLSCRVNPSL